MNVTKFFFLILFVFLSAPLAAQDTLSFTSEDPAPSPSYPDILKWEEQFTYQVKYSFFNLGNVEVEVLRDTLDSEEHWRLKTVITSNSSVPFVGREEHHYNSIFSVTDSLLRELLYWRDNVDEEEYRDAYYRFDYDRRKIYAREKGKESDTLRLEKNGGTGHLVFLIARKLAGTGTGLKLPVYIEMNKGHLKLQSTGEMEMREYEAFKQPVNTYYSEGETDIEGPFGFKGAFKSWYMADSLRVPLEAHVKVWVGNVKIELINYTKKLRK